MTRKGLSTKKKFYENAYVTHFIALHTMSNITESHYSEIDFGDQALLGRNLLRRIHHLHTTTRSHMDILRAMEQHLTEIMNLLRTNDDPSLHEFLAVDSNMHLVNRPPVLFQAYLLAQYVESDPDMYIVEGNPRTPRGGRCKLEDGQVIVVMPDFTTAWMLSGFHELSLTYVVYDAVAVGTGETCEIWVAKQWSSVSQNLLTIQMHSSHQFIRHDTRRATIIEVETEEDDIASTDEEIDPSEESL
jgi:hypothetical protein